MSTEPERQAAAVAAIRKLSASQYVTAASLESLAAGLIATPAFFVWYTMEGIALARYPRPVPGTTTPPIPQTFGGLLSAGLKYSLSCTTRTVTWFGVTTALASVGKEVMKVGPRYQSGPPAIQSPAVVLCNAGAGALTAYWLMLDWKMQPLRRAMYVGLGGVSGLALPLLLGLYGPAVRARMMKYLPQLADKKDDGSSNAPPPSSSLQ